MEEADLVAVGVAEVSLTPEPGAVGGVFVEVEAEGFEAADFGVEVVAFEVEDDGLRGGHTP